MTIDYFLMNYQVPFRNMNLITFAYFNFHTSNFLPLQLILGKRL